MSDGTHNIYPLEIDIFTTQVVYIAFIHASWRPQHLYLRDGVHCIYS